MVRICYILLYTYTVINTQTHPKGWDGSLALQCEGREASWQLDSEHLDGPGFEPKP